MTTHAHLPNDQPATRQAAKKQSGRAVPTSRIQSKQAKGAYKRTSSGIVVGTLSTLHIDADLELHDDVHGQGAPLAVVGARTLVVYGDRDPLYPVEIGVALYRAIARSALWVVPGGGHLPVFGAQRPDCVRVARAFLAG
jgi:pimeloyl-ACP methyl ester carboxylesterase